MPGHTARAAETAPSDPSAPVHTGLRRATPADASAVRDLTRAAYARWIDDRSNLCSTRGSR